MHDGIDVVLMDRRMPDLSGDETLEELESQEHDFRVAMITAVEPDFDLIGMGFDDYLVKPIESQTLLDAVDRLFALDEYESIYQELSSKLVKKNILEVEKTKNELGESEEFIELRDRIEELEAKLEDIQSDRDFDERLLPS